MWQVRWLQGATLLCTTGEAQMKQTSASTSSSSSPSPLSPLAVAVALAGVRFVPSILALPGAIVGVELVVVVVLVLVLVLVGCEEVWPPLPRPFPLLPPPPPLDRVSEDPCS